MGCGPSKGDLLAVQEATGMTKKDASASHKGFKKEAGGDKVKLDKFTKLVSSLNTNKGDFIFTELWIHKNVQSYSQTFHKKFKNWVSNLSNYFLSPKANKKICKKLACS